MFDCSEMRKHNLSVVQFLSRLMWHLHSPPANHVTLLPPLTPSQSCYTVTPVNNSLYTPHNFTNHRIKWIKFKLSWTFSIMVYYDRLHQIHALIKKNPYLTKTTGIALKRLYKKSFKVWNQISPSIWNAICTIHCTLMDIDILFNFVLVMSHCVT